jgi:hypothetical protein
VRVLKGDVQLITAGWMYLSSCLCDREPLIDYPPIEELNQSVGVAGRNADHGSQMRHLLSADRSIIYDLSDEAGSL